MMIKAERSPKLMRKPKRHGINGRDPARLGSLVGPHDVALPVHTTEYVRTRMAATLEVEAK
jgi:hypothetical protein